MYMVKSVEDIQKKAREKYYNRYTERIVGIMLARYDLEITRRMIDENYLYWHYNTGRQFDVFWCGYENHFPHSRCRNDSVFSCDLIHVNGGRNDSTYFSREAFIEAKDYLNECVKGVYNDHIQLILVNYQEGHLDFYSQSARIDLEKKAQENLTDIRSFMEWLTNECKKSKSIQQMYRDLKIKNTLDKLRGIELSDWLSNALSVAGLLIP